MHRFLVEPSHITEGKAEIWGDEAKHLAKVLRLKKGDKIAIFDGIGHEYFCVLDEVTASKALASIIETRKNDREAPIEIWLVQGMPKGEKMDLIVQKATELGVKGIIPLMTDRAIVQLDAKKRTSRVERWQKIADEAAKQCKRNRIPEVKDVAEWNSLDEVLPSDAILLVPWEGEQVEGIKSKLANINTLEKKPIYIFIGPEGGLTEKEVISLKKRGASPVTLGPRILRTETAGLTAIAVTMYQLGDLGG